MKIEIKNWDYAKKAQRYVRLSIKKFRLVRDRENFLIEKGFKVKVTPLRDYCGLANHEDYLFKNKGMIERRIIVGRPYEHYHGNYMGNERPSRTALCVILKTKADEVKFKTINK